MKRLSPHCLLVMYALENYRDATYDDIADMTGLRHGQVFGVMLRLGRLELTTHKWAYLDRPTLTTNLNARGKAHLMSLRGVAA